MKHIIVLTAMIGFFCFLVVTLTTSPPATAVSLSDQYYSHTFTVGNDTWAYVDIDRSNGSANATVEIWFWSSNLTVRIVESNVENATIHTADLINGSGLTDAQLSDYLALAGRLTVVVSGEGTDNLTIEDCPEVENLYVDGSLVSFTWLGNNLIFSISLSEHEIVVDFTTAEQVNSLTTLMIDVFFPAMIVIMLMSAIFVSFNRMGRGIK